MGIACQYLTVIFSTFLDRRSIAGLEINNLHIDSSLSNATLTLPF